MDDKKLAEEYLARIPRSSAERIPWLMELIGKIRKDERQEKTNT